MVPPPGAVTAAYLYDAWGNYRELDITDPSVPGEPVWTAIPDLDPDGLYAWESYLANIQSAYDPTSLEPPASNPATWNPLTYTGHEFDPETGLYYFKARFYDPELGRFASADPYLGDSLTPPSLHRYLYAYANPLKFVDMTGYLAYRYFGREAGNGQERPYVVAEIETEDVYRLPIHSILSGYRFEDIAQQNAFLNELGRLNPGIVSVDAQGHTGWDLEVLGRAGQAVRLPVSADYRLTDAATAEIVAESGGATNMDEWRRHQLARQVPQAVRQRVQTTVNMARKTVERLAEWSQDSAETLAFGPYKMGADSVAIAEWAGRLMTESGRQEFSEAVYRKLEYLLRTEAGAEDVSATLLALFILGRITPPSAEHTWLKLESPGPLNKASQVASSREAITDSSRMLPAPSTARLSGDAAVKPGVPRRLPTTRPIGNSSAQNTQLQADIRQAITEGARDIRVNQQQVTAIGVRVGRNRPDLQYTRADGTRVYIEYDTPKSGRGVPHADRLLANDPKGVVVTKTIK